MKNQTNNLSEYKFQIEKPTNYKLLNNVNHFKEAIYYALINSKNLEILNSSILKEKFIDSLKKNGIYDDIDNLLSRNSETKDEKINNLLRLDKTFVFLYMLSNILDENEFENYLEILINLNEIDFKKLKWENIKLNDFKNIKESEKKNQEFDITIIEDLCDYFGNIKYRKITGLNTPEYRSIVKVLIEKLSEYFKNNPFMTETKIMLIQSEAFIKPFVDEAKKEERKKFKAYFETILWQSEELDKIDNKKLFIEPILWQSEKLNEIDEEEPLENKKSDIIIQWDISKLENKSKLEIFNTELLSSWYEIKNIFNEIKETEYNSNKFNELKFWINKKDYLWEKTFFIYGSDFDEMRKKISELNRDYFKVLKEKLLEKSLDNEIISVILGFDNEADLKNKLEFTRYSEILSIIIEEYNKDKNIINIYKNVFKNFKNNEYKNIASAKKIYDIMYNNLPKHDMFSNLEALEKIDKIFQNDKSTLFILYKLCENKESLNKIWSSIFEVDKIRENKFIEFFIELNCKKSENINNKIQNINFDIFGTLIKNIDYDTILFIQKFKLMGADFQSIKNKSFNQILEFLGETIRYPYIQYKFGWTSMINHRRTEFIAKEIPNKKLIYSEELGEKIRKKLWKYSSIFRGMFIDSRRIEEAIISLNEESKFEKFLNILKLIPDEDFERQEIDIYDLGFFLEYDNSYLFSEEAIKFWYFSTMRYIIYQEDNEIIYNFNKYISYCSNYNKKDIDSFLYYNYNEIFNKENRWKFIYLEMLIENLWLIDWTSIFLSEKLDNLDNYRINEILEKHKKA